MPSPISTGMGDHVWDSTPSEGKSISLYNESSRSTQPSHPSVGKRIEYQPKGSDALLLGSKARYGS